MGRRIETIESHALELRRAEATASERDYLEAFVPNSPTDLVRCIQNSLKIKRERVGIVLAKDNAKDKQIIIVQYPRTHPTVMTSHTGMKGDHHGKSKK
jgi:hypothetical protein